MEITGHPLLHLWLSCSHEDTQVFAYLEDETPDGEVYVITEGMLRARHRKVSTAPYHCGGPYRSYRRGDAAPMDRNQACVVLVDLLPISWRLPQGHRLRLALGGADADHFELPDAAATWGVHRGGDRASYLELPVVNEG